MKISALLAFLGFFIASLTASLLTQTSAKFHAQLKQTPQISQKPVASWFINGEPDKKIYHEGWIDLNKNGVKDPYEDPSIELETRISDLLARMTLEEKTAQMVTLYGFPRVLKDELPTAAWKTALWKDGIGNIDEHIN